jgi:acetyltransferase-like isoleucine patch superfamily enzyme
MMSLERVLYKIRKRESPFYSSLKDLLLRIIDFDLPAPRVIFRPLYELVILSRFLFGIVLQKLLYVPIFRSRLSQCGKGLTLPNGIPWVEGHLRIHVGDNVMLDATVITSGSVHDEPVLMIGDRTGLGYQTHVNVGESVKIGNDCMIANECFITDNDLHPLDPARRIRKEPIRPDEIKPIVIEDNVWLGKRVVVLKGVTIGKGSIVSANSVVTRSIPPYSIAMGVPARIVLTGIDRVYGDKREKEDNAPSSNTPVLDDFK